MNLIKYVIYLKTESINQFTKVEETNNNILGIARVVRDSKNLVAAGKKSLKNH